jgi:Fe-S oxidoreductase
MDVCPSAIEHVPIIAQLRRQLVEMGALDDGLQSTLQRVFESGNAFGEGRRKRARWTRDAVPSIKDARREAVEFLWFVGDYAALDPDTRHATLALAALLDAADIKVGILMEDERSAACDVRRAGEEGLWAMHAEQNMALLETCEFASILTSDPHTFHTLLHEYPLDGRWPVVHHTQLLSDLLRDGSLSPSRRLDVTVTYHDPCYIGRYNGIYNAPRQVLQAVGAHLVEMPRHGRDSFCCGAGGGRIWMKETDRRGAPRPAEQRVEEAMALAGIESFVVACPKDLKMFQDAVKTTQNDSRLAVREISELVLEAVQ